MKILFVSHYSALYGANLSMLGLIEDLRKRYGCEITVLVPFFGDLTGKLEELGIKYIVTPFYQWEQPNKKTIISKLKNTIKKLLNQFYFYNAYKLLSKDFDIVHSNSSVIHIGDYLSDKLNIPHIWHLREYGKADYGLDYIYSLKYVKRCYERAIACIAISNDILTYYQNIFPSCIFSKIYNGIKPCDRIEKTTVTDQHIVKFCCVGLICEGKRQIDILYAVKKLVENDLNNFHISFVGKGDERYISLLKKFIEINNLQTYVTFLGHQKNVLEILKKEDVGIITSKREAFGRVTVEYMFSSMPVIGAASGGTVEIIQDGVTGLLYQPENIEELFLKMKFFLENRKSISEFGKNGRKRAEECFSIEKNTDAIMELYKKVLHLV